ncbi:MAG: thioredoxin [Clostridia bacterium]|nr:thioredoxin [Clostridia bacterium]
MSVLKLNNDSFDEAVKDGRVLVDFYADWCGPCRMMAPILEAVSEERADLKVAKVNVDESSELAAKFGVMSIPTLVLLNDGDEIKRIVGARPKDALLQEIDA